jgi:hypothetical protein
MMRKKLSRRTFLRGAGATIALPLLDAMIPTGRAAKKIKAPRRLAFVYVPNGIDMPNWTPTKEGAGFDLPCILGPLAPYRDELLPMSGLMQNNGRALGDGPGDHARAAASYLTAAHPKKTDGADIWAGVSVDQVAAQKVGSITRFPSLELGLEDWKLSGNCDSGYSCAYVNSIAWRTPTTPLPPEINPRLVFERLFGADSGDPATRARRARYNKSILDFVLEDSRRLQGTLGPTDQRKLDEYLSAVREIEKRIESAERTNQTFTPSIEKPAGIPIDFSQHARLMFDLLAVAFQADLTRIATFMLAREGSTRAYREINISDAHHPLTHHRNNQEMIDKICQINRYHIEQFAYLVGRLKAIKEGDGSLLDHAVVVYGSGLSDGNRHDHADLPVLVAGRGAGALRTGRHVRYPYETPMANLYVALLDLMGVPTESFGDSTGKLERFTTV